MDALFEKISRLSLEEKALIFRRTEEMVSSGRDQYLTDAVESVVEAMTVTGHPIYVVMEVFADALGYASASKMISSPPGSGKAKTRRKAVPIYKDPTNPDNVWSGRGRPPAWYQNFIEGGGNSEDVKIAATPKEIIPSASPVVA